MQRNCRRVYICDFLHKNSVRSGDDFKGDLNLKQLKFLFRDPELLVKLYVVGCSVCYSSDMISQVGGKQMTPVPESKRGYVIIQLKHSFCVSFPGFLGRLKLTKMISSYIQ